MKLEHYFLYRDVDVDIKKVDKIEITDVDCYEGPNDTLIITKNNYPKFKEKIHFVPLACDKTYEENAQILNNANKTKTTKPKADYL